MNAKSFINRISILAIILLAGILAGCSRPQGTATPVAPSATGATPEETFTPTPTAEPPVIWLIADQNVSAAIRQEFSGWLSAKAEQNGLRFLEMESFNSSDGQGQLKAAVFLFPDEEVANLAANLPDTQFVVVTDADLPTAANLSVIQTSTNQAAFLAGYLATLNSPDFRSGGLFVDDAAGKQLEESYLNGGRYLCGRCSPVFTPFVNFPLTSLVPVGSDTTAWQSAFDELNQNRIEVLYIAGEGLTPELLSYLADKNVGILSDAPPPSGFESIWIATVSSDPLSALEEFWPDVMAGAGGKKVLAGLEISQVNSDNLSSGRLELAEKLIPDLQGGWITPLSMP